MVVSIRTTKQGILLLSSIICATGSAMAIKWSDARGPQSVWELQDTVLDHIGSILEARCVAVKLGRGVYKLWWRVE